MVQVHSEVMRMMEAAEDEMAEMDQIIVGGWVRLEVPFDSIARLKQWRDLMRGFLNTVDFYCQPRVPGEPYVNQRARLFHLRGEASNINRTIRGANGPGRPRKYPHPDRSGDK